MKNLGLWLSGFRFSRMEFSGSLGDLGTFLPLVVTMCLACDLDLGIVLICAGMMNIATGLLFRQPIPVQPMKAIAAVAITEGLLRDEVAASGYILGAVMLVLALTGAIDLITRSVPKAIVRGIQLGVGIKLAGLGISWIAKLPLVGADSILLAALVLIVLLFLWTRRQPAVLYVFVGGLIFLLLTRSEIYQGVQLALPSVDIRWPAPSAWLSGLWKAGLPQIPLTVLNSVVAVCALSADYFPGRGIPPRRMALSVGLMNLACMPLGGIPICHGSGGLAAQYLFGARTGGSVVMLGLLKVTAGLLFGGALLGLLKSYPVGILGLLLVFAGIELARAARDITASSGFVVALVTAIAIIGVDTTVGFLAGCVTAALFGFIARSSRGVWQPTPSHHRREERSAPRRPRPCRR